MNHGWNGGGWASGRYAFGFPWAGVVAVVLFLALLVVVVLMYLRMRKTDRPDLSAARERGVEILIERYTRGEIDAETFRTMKSELDFKF